jgi:hypothetical protein
MSKVLTGYGLALLVILHFHGNVDAFSDGYILGAHHSNSAKTYLFDKDLNIVHTWNHEGQESPQNGYACYLLENGHLLRSGISQNAVSSGAFPKQGTISEIDANKNFVWSCTLEDTVRMLHHDFKVLPNGNILMVSFVCYCKDSAIAAGLDSALFTSGGRIFSGLSKTQFGMSDNSVQLESLLELQPDRSGGGNHTIVWEWNIIDHVISPDLALEHPEKIKTDLGPFFVGQWVHLNGMDYDPVKDLIVFSSRVFSEFFIIDHSTSTTEAAGSTGGTYGKGGDLLYRWGRPSNYCRQSMLIDSFWVVNRRSRQEEEEEEVDSTLQFDTTYYHENDVVHCLHCPTWIPEGYPGAGNVMFFHNNVDAAMSKLGNSQIIEVTPDINADGQFVMSPGTPTIPLTPTWIYTPQDDMFSQSMSSAIRMPSGNTIIHEAYPGGNYSGTNSIIREVDRNGTVVWGPQEMVLPSDTIVRNDTSFRFEEVIVDDSVVRIDTIMHIDTNTFINRYAFNAAKIMYYPGTYSGVQALMSAIGKEYGTPRLSSKNVPHIRKAGNTLRFSGVAEMTISLYTIQGRLIKKLQPKHAVALMSIRSLSAGSYIAKITLRDKVTCCTVLSVIR